MTAGAVEQPRRYELALFVLLAFAISWAMYIPLALATLRSGDATASIGSPLNLLAPWGPAVAAIIVTILVMGRRGPGTLFRQLRVWRVGIWWYLIAGLLPAGLWLVGRSLDTPTRPQLHGRVGRHRPGPRSLPCGVPDRRLRLHVG